MTTELEEAKAWAEDAIRQGSECAPAPVGGGHLRSFRFSQGQPEGLHMTEPKAPSVALDPRDPDPTREGVFRHHDCWACQNGTKPCRQGAPNRCDNPRARND